LTPHPVVTELAYQSSRGKPSAPADATSSRLDSAPAPQAAPQPAPALPAASSSAPAGSALAQASALQRSEKVNVDMLRLATELTTPIPQRSPGGSSSRSGTKTAAGAAK